MTVHDDGLHGQRSVAVPLPVWRVEDLCTKSPMHPLQIATAVDVAVNPTPTRSFRGRAHHRLRGLEVQFRHLAECVRTMRRHERAGRRNHRVGCP